MSNDLGPLLKGIYPKVVATLIRVLGDMDRAMDATQDALVRALQVWQEEGIPDNPVAWLVTVGRNRAIDQIRRESRVVSIEGAAPNLLDGGAGLQGEYEVHAAHRGQFEYASDFDWTQVDDDLLRLMFTCCHPALNAPAQIVLILKVVLGFSVQEIARGLLASPAGIEKRITRAKARLRDAGVPYEVPPAAEMPARLDAVLRAVYLIFNEGYTRTQDAELARGSLIDVAIRLGRMISRLFRHDPEPRSLLALMLLTAARLPARVDAEGVFVPLQRQQRSLWNQSMIAEGIAIIDAVFAARHLPGAYQIQAAISALHCRAPSAQATDWSQIVALYEKLEEYDTSPVIPVNHAVALCFCNRPAEALAELTTPGNVAALKAYQPYYAALAFVAEHMNQIEDALEAIGKAHELAPSRAQRIYLERERARLESI